MIHMNDLNRQYQRIKTEIEESIMNVLEQGKYIMGPEVQYLEQKLIEYTGAKYAISCSSGTDALLMTLMAWDIGAGDAVFTTPFTFIATAEVISMLGATPVFVDIDEDSFNINPLVLEATIENTIREGKLTPKAIVAVDLFGLPAHYDAMKPIAEKYGLKILEDAAQSFGGTYSGRKSGNLADAAATSFFPAKPLGCYGDGGAIFTNDIDVYQRLKSIRVHGQGLDKYDNVRLGLNGRLDAIQAAILLCKLKIFDDELIKRNSIAARYTKGLSGAIKTPKIPTESYSSWAQYSVLSKNQEQRKQVCDGLAAKGIATAIYYPKPLHLQTAYQKLGYKQGDFPVAEDVCNRIFSLPMYPYLREDEVDFVIDAVISTLRE